MNHQPFNVDLLKTRLIDGRHFTIVDQCIVEVYRPIIVLDDMIGPVGMSGGIPFQAKQLDITDWSEIMVAEKLRETGIAAFAFYMIQETAVKRTLRYGSLNNIDIANFLRERGVIDVRGVPIETGLAYVESRIASSNTEKEV